MKASWMRAGGAGAPPRHTLIGLELVGVAAWVASRLLVAVALLPVSLLPKSLLRLRRAQAPAHTTKIPACPRCLRAGWPPTDVTCYLAIPGAGRCTM